VEWSHSPPAPPQIPWQVTVKSTCQVNLSSQLERWPPSNLALEHIEGYKEEGQVTVIAKKKVQIDHFLIFFSKQFSVKKMFFEIIFSLICTMMTLTRKATLNSLESVEKMSERGYCFVNLIWNFAGFRLVKTSWIPGTYTLFTINKFTEIFSDDDEWIFTLC